MVRTLANKDVRTVRSVVLDAARAVHDVDRLPKVAGRPPRPGAAQVYLAVAVHATRVGPTLTSHQPPSYFAFRHLEHRTVAMQGLRVLHHALAPRSAYCHSWSISEKAFNWSTRGFCFGQLGPPPHRQRGPGRAEPLPDGPASGRGGSPDHRQARTGRYGHPLWPALASEAHGRRAAGDQRRTSRPTSPRSTKETGMGVAGSISG